MLDQETPSAISRIGIRVQIGEETSTEGDTNRDLAKESHLTNNAEPKEYHEIQRAFADATAYVAKIETKIQEKIRQARRAQKFKRLNATHAEDAELAEKFECNICFNIAEEIVICACCEAFFCGTCIIEWNKKSEDCPKCRKYFNVAPPQRFVHNTINSLRFFCK